ncbi:MAG TPA: hypothetical protein VNN22_24235 [Verrucomicrobiae bacterium]|nr:hypothetical protein [Verrucomicrobiae bacterium]
MKAKTKLKANPVGAAPSELTRFKELWRDKFTDSQWDYWRGQFVSATPTRDTRESLRLKFGINLTDDDQIVRFRKWDADEQKRQDESERMASDEKFFIKEFGDSLSKEQIREMVLGASYRRSLVTGDFKEGRATMRLDLDQETAKFNAQLETAKLELKRESEARMKEQFKLAREQFEFDAAKACLKALPALKVIASNKTLSESEKTQMFMEKLFGKAPTEPRPGNQ